MPQDIFTNKNVQMTWVSNDYLGKKALTIFCQCFFVEPGLALKGFSTCKATTD